MSEPYVFDESKQGVLYILELETTLPYAYWSVNQYNNWEGGWWPRESNASIRKKKPKEQFIKIGYSTRTYDYDRYEDRKWQMEKEGLRIIDELRVYEMRDPWHKEMEYDLFPSGLLWNPAKGGDGPPKSEWKKKYDYDPMWCAFSGSSECYVPELKQELDVIDDMVSEYVSRKIDETIIKMEEDIEKMKGEKNVWNN
mgnify:CR=1 FL=1